MRFLILDTLYRQFVDFVYASHPGLETQPSCEQLDIIYGYGFGKADFLMRNLRAQGHEATQILVNVPQLQRKIASELQVATPPELGAWRAKATHASRAAWRRLVGPAPLSPAERNLLGAQIETFRPDVVINADVLALPASYLQPLRGNGVRLIGQCAYPIPTRMSLTGYDVMVSALPSYVDRFRAEGVRTLYLPHGFEASALRRVGVQEQADDVVFIGSVSGHHVRRLKLLEGLAERVPLRLIGPTPHGLPPRSPLVGKVQRPLWGYEMLRALARAKVVLNVHAELAGAYAANMRLFETTGVGALLLTDWKETLGEFFRVGEEVAAFHDLPDCLAQVQHYLGDDEARRRVALAGQTRTLRDHTYAARVSTLLDFLQ